MIRTMLRLTARPGCESVLDVACRTVAGQIAGLAGGVRQEVLRDATDPAVLVLVTEWVDESARRRYADGPVATRFVDAVRPLCAAPPRERVMRDAPTGSTIYVDVELTVPADRRAEFRRGYVEVLARMAGVPGYLREELLREPGSDTHHIFAEWRGEAEFHRWIGNPAHAREEAGPIAPFLLDIRRRLFHAVTDPDSSREPSAGREADVHRTTDVLVVGAGPTGLTVAVELARRGVECQVIDKLAAPPGQADKAIGVHCRTMELWEEQGIVREAMDAGVWLTGNMVFVNGVETHRMSWELPGLPYAHLGLPQYETERLLTERLATLGVRPRRGTELVSFSQDDDGVSAVLATPDGGTEEVRAKYLVGCDGAHSRVRELLGLTFTGGLGRFPQLFMLGDVDVDWDMPDGHLLRFLHETDGRMDGMLVCVPLRGEHRYRIATLAPPRFFAQTGGQDAPPGFSEELAEPTLADVQAALDRLAPPGTRASNLRWSSVFRISHGIVDRYRDGRVFVAGDAAHLHPPAGGQGMNTGIQDAWNLAWKLALAVRGIAAPGLLDSYETERRPEGEEIVGRAVRMAFTDELDRADLERQFLQEMSLLLSYAGSPLVGESVADPDALRGGPGPGDLAPDVAGLHRRGVGHPLRLRDLTRGTRHTLLLYADATADEKALTAMAELSADAQRQMSGELDAYLLLSPDARAPRLPAPPAVVDADGAFRARYGVAGTALYLVRPDGHVGYRSQPVDGDGLRKHLHLLFGGAR
ncbi:MULTISPECIES: FAD-dependent monooxygenase [Micromonospora]|uniref:FAD-binding protein n=1 Tax=Micromonospora solifontis TaxID=2487138 RepID=A0ABX9WFI1_9ACTN|nr:MULTISPECIES: FAD-dependent monooxygenase [Micromonospora]NES15094.1 NAD(P)-binding protein [Micromonospora sp. PPF5-17B]NES37194.1 NAD(P)-binding protein [Micromonospora solifontis]NES56231.1 NAD(P)-binding protein [Micromonospora sp. PPF5-6]RNL98641.1 FAD-binding protein [Micromonospora solifontis]